MFARPGRIHVMKRFLIAAIAMTAVAAPVPLSAQPAPAASAPAPAQSLNRMPAGGRATSERGQPGSVVRAHHRRHMTHASRMTSHDTTNQLNQQELARIQSANQGPAGEQGNPTTMNRMSVGGRATSGGPTQ